tara:strand:- start:783 stop:1016 length:234 start_codon:yes stop_codon:yes gene_type:complete
MDMPLYETGLKTPALSGVNAQAKDNNDNLVVVSASSEVIQDYGWPRIWEMASKKYDAGDVDRNGKVPKVGVKTSDFA